MKKIIATLCLAVALLASPFAGAASANHIPPGPWNSEHSWCHSANAFRLSVGLRPIYCVYANPRIGRYVGYNLGYHSQA